MKTVLTIQSQVAGASVGNSAAGFALQRLGVRAIEAPSVVYGRRPDRGPHGGAAVELAPFFQAIEDDGLFPQIDAILSGYIASPAQAEVIAGVVARVKAANTAAFYACDPVMGDNGAPYVAAPVCDAIMRELVPIADLVTPNLYELSRLAGGGALHDLSETRAAAKSLGKPVLVSSVPGDDNNIGVLYAAPTGDWFAQTPRLGHAPHGTGDLLTALFVARRVKGEGAAVALEGATGAVYDVCVRALAAGRDDLVLPWVQDVLAEPKTWPRAVRLDG